MGTMRQIIVYAKVVILCLVVVLVLTVIWMNRGYKTQFWPWASAEPVPTLWLMLATSVTSIVVFWIVLKVRRVFFELAEVRRQRQLGDAAAEQVRRQAELSAQEQRIDEKLKQALGGNNSQDAKSD